MYTQNMPNKTVYVSEADLPTWDEANEYAYLHHLSLSKLIIEALRECMSTTPGPPIGR